MNRILKIDPDLRLIVGIAGLSDEVDAHGDVIDDREMTLAAMRAVGRPVKIDHAGEPVGRVLQSFVLTQYVAAMLDLPVPEWGTWLVGLRIDDDVTWRRAKAGEFNGGVSIWYRADTDLVSANVTRLLNIEIAEISILTPGHRPAVRRSRSVIAQPNLSRFFHEFDEVLPNLMETA